jgi:predicted GH43/DUF377 family glycosyl hydrolase
MNAPAFSDLPGYAGRLDASKLQRGMRHYNPSICRVPGELFGRRGNVTMMLCAYRVQNSEGISSVGIAQLGNKLQVVFDTALVVPDVGPKTHVEDPRLIVVDGRLLLFVVQVDYGSSYHFRQRCFVLATRDGEANAIAIGEELPLAFGRNGKGVTEKNWMPFQIHGGGLGLVHSLAPEFKVIEAGSGTWHTSSGVKRWRWGSISGRTTAVRYGDDTMLAFVGGHMPHAKRRRLYWMGAIVFSARAPFTLLGISREPLVWASEFSPALLNPYDNNWNPLCIFPAGLVRENNDQVLLSVGVNDSFCEFLRIDLADLEKTFVEPDQLTGEERLLAAEIPADALSCEQVRVRSVVTHPIGEPGGPYYKGDEFVCPRHRAVALGKMVEVLS